jgi:AraC-like DNA-binding protein
MAVVLNETANVYREWAPHPALATRVVCSWEDPARERPQPVLPDACIDLVWDGHQVFVAGPDTTAVPISTEGSFVGIRFRPGAGPAFLGVGADHLLDARVSLDEIWSDGAARALRDQLLDQPDRAAEVLEAAVLRRLPEVAEPDPLVNQLLLELTCAPDLAPEDALPVGYRLAESLGVSQRTLRRRCTTALGYGPKTLERILRFRRALRLVRSGTPIVDAARRAGYADQAHLTNESQRLAGFTPATLAAQPSFSLAANGCD